MSPKSKLFWLGAFVFLVLALIRGISSEFAVGASPPSWAVVVFVVALVGAGFVWLGLFGVLPQLSGRTNGLVVVGLVGLLMRMLFIGSTPIYEDDWQRYLWDGAVLAEGVSPYAYPPAAASKRDLFGEVVPPSSDASLRRLQELADLYPSNHRSINFPFVSTIYPPIAQSAFALAHAIAPFSLDAWRWLVLVVDSSTFLILIVTLRAFGLNQFWSLLFWWNPLAIYISVNAAHMDALLLPPLLGTLLLVQRRRPWAAAFTLALAVGIKLWPIVLAPALFCRYRDRPVFLLGIAAAVLALSLFFLSPMLLTLDPQHSGLVAYSQSWERNAFLFPLIAGAFGSLHLDGDFLARVVVALVVSSVALAAALRSQSADGVKPSSLIAIVAVLFFVSPTGYPWYALWVFVFLPFAPSMGLGLLTASLPLYYARYALDAVDLSWVSKYVLIPIQFGLPLLVVIFSLIQSRIDSRVGE